MPDPLLDLQVRRRIVAHVEKYPGLHAREVARQLGIDQSLLEYHLDLLAKGQHVLIEFDGHLKRVFPSPDGKALPESSAERRLLGALRDEKSLRIVLHLLRAGALPHKELAALTGLPKPLLTYHLDRLRGKGVIHKRADGLFEAQDPKKTEWMLLRYSPPRDILAGFMDAWNEFYDR